MVGKRLGRNRWSPSNQKTGEGTITFILSVTLSALLLRLLGLTEEFSVSDFCGSRPKLLHALSKLHSSDGGDVRFSDMLAWSHSLHCWKRFPCKTTI